MPRTRSSKCTVDSPSQSARVLPESDVAASSELVFPPVEESVFVDEPRPDVQEGRSSRSLPLLSFQRRTYTLGPFAGLESSSPMPHLEPYWKDDFVFQASGYPRMTHLGVCSQGLAMS